MEKRKDTNKVLTIVMIVCVTLSVVILGIISYDKFLKKEEVTSNNSTKVEVESSNKKCDELSGYVDNLNYVKIFDGMKDYTGQYGAYKWIGMDDLQDRHVFAYLLLDGKIRYKVDNAKNSDIYVLSNINDAIDIIFNDFENNNTLYILLKNGDVYEYSIDDYENRIQSATKVDNLKNIVRFVNLVHCPKEGAGCDLTLGAIDKNNEYFYIDSFSA